MKTQDKRLKVADLADSRPPTLCTRKAFHLEQLSVSADIARTEAASDVQMAAEMPQPIRQSLENVLQCPLNAVARRERRQPLIVEADSVCAASALAETFFCACGADGVRTLSADRSNELDVWSSVRMTALGWARETTSHLRFRGPGAVDRCQIEFRNSHAFEMTTDPSPTDEATRFTEPARTSPTAKIPGRDVAYAELPCPASPVRINPLSSKSIMPVSHSVFG